jgi:bifunctional non-homologous end joining protein LigD
MPRAATRRAHAAKRRKAIGAEPPPRFVEPQLALLCDEAPAGEGWAHEIKLDGYRMHARDPIGQEAYPCHHQAR